MLKNKKRGLLFLLLFLFIFIFGMSFTLARELEVPLPQIGEEPGITETPLLPDYIKYIFNFSIIIAGFIAFGVLIYGGVRYLTSAGSPAVMADAKKQILAAFLGLIVLLFSYLILTTINPQLVILQIPVLERFEPPPISEPILLEQQTLYAEEIPIGKLIDGVGPKIEDGSDTSPYYEYEGVITETRLKRIIKLSEKIWETASTVQKISEEISTISNALLGFIEQCVCENGTPIFDGCDDCRGVRCEGKDPCGPVREIIEEQQEILSNKAGEIAPFEGILKDLKEELELEKEKLENALVELEKGEKMMKECPFSSGKGGKPRALLTFDSFWRYKEALEKRKIIKKIEIEKVWENIIFEVDEAAFYCTEIPIEVSLLEAVSGEELEEILYQEWGIEEPKAYCQEEILFGEMLDNSEDIAQRLIDEMEKIKKEMEKMMEEIPKEVLNANHMSTLPNCRDYSLCGAVGGPVWEWDDCCETDEDDNCIGCDVCIDCAGKCQGDPCPGAKADAATTNGLIQGNHRIITGVIKNITVSGDEVHNLIKGDEIHDLKLIGSLREPTWAYEIINKELPVARKEFGKCVNSAEDWARAVSGEKILTRDIITCSEAKDSCWNVEENYKCYGKKDVEAYPNYFCTESETKQQK